jgi:hypothetical protein
MLGNKLSEQIYDNSVQICVEMAENVLQDPKELPTLKPKDSPLSLLLQQKQTMQRFKEELDELEQQQDVLVRNFVLRQ